MKKGDIVLIPFPFTDLTGKKNRPALILVDSTYDVTVAFITSQLKWKEGHDVSLEPSIRNGIKKSSLIRLSKLTTIDKDLVIGKLGEISNRNPSAINIKAFQPCTHKSLPNLANSSQSNNLQFPI